MAKKKTLLPGVTDNKRGLLSLLGVVLINGVLNQRKFIFDVYSRKALTLFFKGGETEYSEKYVERWWFTFGIISAISSLFIVNKVKPVFIFGIVSIIFAIGQFSIAFSEDNLDMFGAVLGVTGGLAHGFLAVVPLHIIWTQFTAKAKYIVTAFYYFLSMLLSDAVFYWVFRTIWWGQSDIPKSEEDKTK